MSLYIYENIKDIPSQYKVVQNNDAYFKRVSLRKDPFTEYVMRLIDKASFRSEATFYGRDGKSLGGLNKDLLSTGLKTILNVYYNPNMCFNVVECGFNVLYEMVKLKEGIIYWPEPYLFLLEDHDCDIIIDDRRFYKISDFLDYQEEKRHG